jgi:hypothetical protein
MEFQMKSSRVLSILLPLILAGCASTAPVEIRVDGSSLASFRTSWSKLNASLSSQQQAQLNTAVLLIGATKLHDSEYQRSPSFGPETLRGDLDGKNYEDILKAAQATGARVTGVDRPGGST